MKTFIFGDIHGCYDEFIALLEQMDVQEDDRVISVGDIVDRGPKSPEVYRYFKTRKNALVLMGNHERKHQKGVLNYAQEIVKLQFGDEYTEFLSWINSLPYYEDTGEALIVHAAFEHDKSIEKQREDVLCGSTSGDRYLQDKYPEGKFWTDYYEGSKTILYGHHVVGDSPKRVNNTIGTDTGCCHGGKLTAIELPGFVVHQVQAKKDYWAEELQHWQLIVLQNKPWFTMTCVAIDKLVLQLQRADREDVQEYLQKIREWRVYLDQLLTQILEELPRFTAELLEKHPEDFNQKANEYFFKTFLFKAKNKQLTLEELSKKLDSPEKRIALSEALGIVVDQTVSPEIF
ncbi:metallophosphoesterase [Fluviicola sp.]|uniref:metallophosphoesterase n=1 Tax=Fluviicola sp. TaxID=1917219 RepID=UPI0031DE21FF